MGDEEEGEVKKYLYEGERATGEMASITAGEAPKVLTEELALLGPREGSGKGTYVNGDVYEGGFVAGERSGDGVYSYAAPPPGEDEEPKPPIASYEGKWKGGAKSGVGMLTFTSGAKYHGSFKEGKYEGAGTMFYANGDIYTGEWKAGKKDGHGTYFFKESGAKVGGSWTDNILSSGTFTDKYGNAYDGAFASTETSTNYVAGGSFSLASGAADVLPKPTKAELLEEIKAFDKDGNGFIDAEELRAILTRPGSGNTAMDKEEAEVILMILTELFDKNSDGKMSIAEVATAIQNQYTTM